MAMALMKYRHYHYHLLLLFLLINCLPLPALSSSSLSSSGGGGGGGGGGGALVNPFTSRAATIRYWNRKVPNNAPHPGFLLSLLSPLPSSIASLPYSSSPLPPPSASPPASSALTPPSSTPTPLLPQLPAFNALIARVKKELWQGFTLLPSVVAFFILLLNFELWFSLSWLDSTSVPTPILSVLSLLLLESEVGLESEVEFES